MKTLKLISPILTLLYTTSFVQAQIIGPFTNQFLQGTAVANDSLNYVNPTPITNSTVAYNTIDDTTGNRYVGAPPPPATPTDLNDFTIIASNTFINNAGNPQSATITNTTSINPLSNSRIQHNQGYSAANAVPGWVNNPGHLITNSLEIRFASHLNVTRLQLNVGSLNTVGVAWEHSLVQILDDTMTPFSAVTGPSWTLGAPGQYLTAAATGGYTGTAGLGNYVAASTGTVTNVGGTTGTGTSGPGDAPPTLDTDTTWGPTPFTRIGGFRLITFFEDVRGAGNGATNFTSSLLDFTITYTIPEPGTVASLALGVAFLGLVGYRHLRRRVPQSQV